MKTGDAIFENEIEFSFLIVHEIVEETDDVLVVHFAKKLNFHANVVFPVGNLPKFPFLDDFHRFPAQRNAV